MGLIAEFTVQTPLLEYTRQRVPEMEFNVEDLQLLENGSTKYVFWTTSDDFDRLETAMGSDPTVKAFTLITEVNDRRLYRVTFSQEAKQYLTYPAASKSDVVFLKWTATQNGSRARARVPNREALQAYRQACEERDIPFQLDRIYEEGGEKNNNKFGLTAPQFEALVLAYHQGYFGAEREVTLEELASELDISRQALAARLRRGHERLIANTLIFDSGGDVT